MGSRVSLDDMIGCSGKAFFVEAVLENVTL